MSSIAFDCHDFIDSFNLEQLQSLSLPFITLPSLQNTVFLSFLPRNRMLLILSLTFCHDQLLLCILKQNTILVIFCASQFSALVGGSNFDSVMLVA